MSVKRNVTVPCGSAAIAVIVACPSPSGRTARSDAGCGPVCGQVGSAFPGPARPETPEHRARDELAGHDGLALAELRREGEKRRRNEGERLHDEPQLRA